MMIKHLYVHVPFCRNICYYCDFARTVYNENNVDRWLIALKEEVSAIDGEKEKYETIYIGGGTPSSLNLAQLSSLLEILKPLSQNVIEYTFEANPESLNKDKIKLLKAYGVNRISLGVESTDDKLLKMMNRYHNYDDVCQRIKELKEAGIYNISVDLIYSLPTQTLEQLKQSINDLLKLDITHISLYSLTIEENSVFGKKGYRSLDQDIEADMYEYIEKRLKKEGFIHYEVANFCKPGYHSKHNMGYWRYDDFRGISSGASSKINHQRYTITRDLKKYLEDIHTYDEKISLSLKDEMFENVMMSLRTLEGLDLAQFKERYGADATAVYKEAILKHKDDVFIEDGRLICSNMGLLNSILIDFLD